MSDSRLSIPEQHQLRIARATLRMDDAMARVMGPITKEKVTKEHPIVHDWWTCGCATCQQRAKAAVASVIQPVVQWMAK
jgi:hypothetical protein